MEIISRYSLNVTKKTIKMFSVNEMTKTPEMVTFTAVGKKSAETFGPSSCPDFFRSRYDHLLNQKVHGSV